MAGSTTNINIQMDSDLKAQADALFGELGMDLSTAFNIFVRQALREGRIPFNIHLCHHTLFFRRMEQPIIILCANVAVKGTNALIFIGGFIHVPNTGIFVRNT